MLLRSGIKIRKWLMTIIFMMGLTGSAFAFTRQPPPSHDINNPPPPRHEERPPEPPRRNEERPPTPPPIHEERPDPPPRPEERRPPAPPARKEERPPTVIEGGRTQGGMTADQVDALLEAGYEMDEIMLADAIAARHGLKADFLLAKRRDGQTWDQIVPWVSREYPAESRPTLPDSVRISTIAKLTGLSEPEVEALREAGHEFDDMAHAKQYAEYYRITIAEVLLQKGRRDWETTARLLGANQDERFVAFVMQRTGLKRQELQALIRKGYNSIDILQAAEGSRVSGRSIEDILELHAGRDWLEVLQEIFPASEPPQRTEAPTGKGGN